MNVAKRIAQLNNSLAQIQAVFDSNGIRRPKNLSVF
jgi:hypothetical protein